MDMAKVLDQCRYAKLIALSLLLSENALRCRIYDNSGDPFAVRPLLYDIECVGLLVTDYRRTQVLRVTLIAGFAVMLFNTVYY
jgi:hypothetical protein